MSLDLVVASNSEDFDFTEFAVGLVRIGEIDVNSVKDMVKKVFGKVILKGTAVRRLDLYAHGAPTYMKVGSDVVHEFTIKTHLPTLGQLKGAFDDDGFVVLNVCEVGQSRIVTLALARTLGVPVYANTGDVSPNLGLTWGVPVVGMPDGTYRTNVLDPDAQGAVDSTLWPSQNVPW